jgi:predicted transcriptional regulator
MVLRKAGSRTSRVSVTLDQADHEFLERLAGEQERSVSWVAARAIHLFLADARKMSGTVPGFEPPAKDS